MREHKHSQASWKILQRIMLDTYSSIDGVLKSDQRYGAERELIEYYTMLIEVFLVWL